MNNLYRIIAVLIYPLLILFTFFIVLRKDKYKQIFKNNIESIVFNTVLISVILSLFIFIFLKQENTIYSWDYSGHWVRSLTLRRIFFEKPQSIFIEIYKSLNYSDYSYLPALFTLPFTIINTSYICFCIGNFIMFFIPLFILLQIVYFSYFDNYKWLPSILFIVFYPLFFPILEGKSCGCGLIFFVASYLLLFLQETKDIEIIDSLSINLFIYIAIFERRWYLYAAVVLYLSFFVKYLFSLKEINNKLSFFFTRVLSSGIILLLIALLFNMPFIERVLTSNYSEIYSTYSKDGKLLSFINYYSLLICAISIFGSVLIYRKNKTFFFINTLSLVISTILFWNVQSFETHHYYISMINILFPFAYGLCSLIPIIKKYCVLVIGILLIQSMLVFIDIKPIPFFTTLKRTPQHMDNINEYKELCSYMKNLLGKDDVAYICGSSNIFNEDIIRNSQLPDLDMPTFEYAQVDLVDGFPNNIDYIRYILITEPLQYYDKDSQHVHEILANAIQNKKEFKNIYSLHDTYKLGDINIKIYEKQGNYSQDMKQFLFDEIIKYYPNNKNIFEEILQ